MKDFVSDKKYKWIRLFIARNLPAASSLALAAAAEHYKENMLV